MISPKDIEKQATRWYTDFLRAELLGKNLFPKEVRFAKVKPNQIASRFEELHRGLLQLRINSKEERGTGYSVVWEEINNRTIGKNLFPVSIQVSSKADYLMLLSPELRKHHKQFVQASDQLLREFPQLSDWVLNRVSRVGDYGPLWPDLIKVCHWFLHDNQKNRYYIRELPVAVPTKFVEQNKSILSELLLQLLPANQINLTFIGNRDHNFEKRFGLKYDETLIRLRFLDPAMVVDGLDDLSIRHSTFARHPFRGKRVIVTENKMNFLTLPPLPQTIALWGGGFQVHLLGQALWLKKRKIYYWGDLDTHGLYILSQLREQFKGAESLMMDRKTFDQFYTGDHAPPIPQVKLDSLHDDELSLFHYLKAENLRLEQEKIPQWYVQQQIDTYLDM
ncbi:MAG: Wadjet anti-phage system protein JetD domain-containing protein [Bacteroidota bacterium]